MVTGVDAVKTITSGDRGAAVPVGGRRRGFGFLFRFLFVQVVEQGGGDGNQDGEQQSQNKLGGEERAFRISKGTLEMRPMFHFTERRIEAHVCICFIAYKVYKELERLIAINKI